MQLREIHVLTYLVEQERMAGFGIGSTTLLLFTLGRTAKDTNLADGMIPGHGPTPDLLRTIGTAGADADSSSGPESATATSASNARGSLKQHFCLGVRDVQDVEVWENWLKEKDVKILSTMKWERGGKSVYFEDLDGNVGEVGSRGIWQNW
jgi:catechol 2,3-dioxygenase-like lactoylglutathione lyase family enzyme